MPRILCPMIYGLLRWTVFFVSLLVLGPVAGLLTSALRGLDGGYQASLLVCTQPGQGLLAGLGAIGLAALAGGAGARLVGKRWGLFCAGMVLAWAAWATGRIDWILERAPSGSSPLRMLALEGVIVGVLGAALAWLILWTPTMPSSLPQYRDPEHQHHHLPPEPSGVFDTTAPMAIGAGLVVAAVVVWLLAQECMKGQTIAAAAVAGVFGAAAVRVASQRVSGAVFMVAVLVLAAVSPLIASLIHNTPGGAAGAAREAKLFALARVMPLDWAAGALLGMPIGLSWASSMVHQHGGADAAKA